MFIKFSDGVEFPLYTAKGKSDLVLSAQDLISIADREVIELLFDSTLVTMDSLMPYFLNPNEKTGIITLTNEDGESFVHTDYVIALKFSMEYVDGEANPFIIIRLAKMNETDKTLREVAGTIKVYTGTELQVAIAKKIDELSAKCHATIETGIDFNGEHFSLTTQDQTNILCWRGVAATEGSAVPYHADGKHCRMYTAEEFIGLSSTAIAHITHNTTYCNLLMRWIETLTDIEQINTVVYGETVLPNEYYEEYKMVMTAIGVDVSESTDNESNESE